MKSMVELSHAFLQDILHPQALVIDATLGQGKDTLFFLQQHAGCIHAFEIDEQVMEETAALLEAEQKKLQEQDPHRKQSRMILHPCSHDEMGILLNQEKGKVDGIIFNFGWYPKEAGRSETLPETSARAVEQALELLRPKGRMALVFYDHVHAAEEQQAVLKILEKHKNDVELYRFKKIFASDAPWLCLVTRKAPRRV